MHASCEDGQGAWARSMRERWGTRAPGPVPALGGDREGEDWDEYRACGFRRGRALIDGAQGCRAPHMEPGGLHLVLLKLEPQTQPWVTPCLPKA
eukprot:361641-Chlamydomonas_euryale.AAC.2